MNFVKNLIGGAIIMVFATVVGVAQNAIRSDSITLFPKIQKPTPRSVTNPTAAEEADPTAVTDPGEVNLSGEATDEELAAGELSKDRLKVIIDAGTAIVIDARGEGEFAEGHIPGALNIPFDNFVEHFADLEAQVPMDATVVCYCRSVTCDLSDNLAQELRLMGYERVLLYRGGWDEWTEAGLPTETADE